MWCYFWHFRTQHVSGSYGAVERRTDIRGSLVFEREYLMQCYQMLRPKADAAQEKKEN